MKIIICGDVSIKDDCKALFDTCQGKTLFNDVIDIFKQSDRVMVNLECAERFIRP